MKSKVVSSSWQKELLALLHPEMLKQVMSEFVQKYVILIKVKIFGVKS
jgi:hypothetical protein